MVVERDSAVISEEARARLVLNLGNKAFTSKRAKNTAKKTTKRKHKYIKCSCTIMADLEEEVVSPVHLHPPALPQMLPPARPPPGHHQPPAPQVGGEGGGGAGGGALQVLLHPLPATALPHPHGSHLVVVRLVTKINSKRFDREICDQLATSCS